MKTAILSILLLPVFTAIIAPVLMIMIVAAVWCLLHCIWTEIKSIVRLVKEGISRNEPGSFYVTETGDLVHIQSRERV